MGGTFSDSSRANMLASGAQLGSFFDATSKSTYTSSLGTEIAYLQRKVYLPLLPQERISYGVLKAYDYLIENEEMPDSQYHPKGYWFAEDVYADFYEGNFYIPMLFPQLYEPGEDPTNFESSMIKYNSAEPNIVGGELATEGFYVKSNYIKLKIPKYIAMMFRSSIPKDTQFLVNFTGGNSQPENITIIGLVSIGGSGSVQEDLSTNAMREEKIHGHESDPWNDQQVSYHGLFKDTDEDSEEQLKELCDIILNNIEAIEAEEDRRKEECEAFQEKEDSLFEK